MAVENESPLFIPYNHSHTVLKAAVVAVNRIFQSLETKDPHGLSRPTADGNSMDINSPLQQQQQQQEEPQEEQEQQQEEEQVDDDATSVVVMDSDAVTDNDNNAGQTSSLSSIPQEDEKEKEEEKEEQVMIGGKPLRHCHSLAGVLDTLPLTAEELDAFSITMDVSCG